MQHLIFVKVATGIGAGIISGGRLHRGAQGAAGDLGHVAALHGGDTPCTCGNVGCLEAVASGPAIVRALRESGIDAVDSRGLIQLAKQGDLAAAAAVREAGREIGHVLATCVSLFNPSVIAVGGLMAQSAESLLAGIREVVYGRSLPLATGELQIVASRTGGQAGVDRRRDDGDPARAVGRPGRAPAGGRRRRLSRASRRPRCPPAPVARRTPRRGPRSGRGRHLVEGADEVLDDAVVDQGPEARAASISSAESSTPLPSRSPAASAAAYPSGVETLCTCQRPPLYPRSPGAAVATLGCAPKKL